MHGTFATLTSLATMAKRHAQTMMVNRAEPLAAPILGQIVSHNLTYTLGIVVRYFGGVKLGTGPLGVAYKTCMGEALNLAECEEKIITSTLIVSIPYTDADTAMRFIREIGADITQRDYDLQGTILTVSVRQDDECALRDRLSKILSLKFVEQD